MNEQLPGMRIWMSISDSPDLTKLGFGERHLKDTFLEFARYVLAAGAEIVYGGDLRKGGYTRALFDLVDLYGVPPGSKPQKRIHNLLAWPRGEKLDPEEEKRLAPYVDFIKLPRPRNYFEGMDKGEASAMSLTEMRTKAQEFVGSKGAQVAMGGKTGDTAIRIPGLLEEVTLAVQHGTPVFVIGAFGGAAKDIGEVMLRIGSGERLLSNHHVGVLRQRGPDGFNNKLSSRENRTLVTTSDLRLALRLTLEGLVRIAGRS